MHFIDVFDRLTKKWMPVVIILCLIIGIAFSEPLGRLQFLVPFLFAFMTFTGALNSNFRQLFDVARHPLPLIISLLVVHIVIPLVALFVSNLCFKVYPDVVTGTVLEFVVPSAVASVMWCTITGGNIALTLSILIIDTLIAPLTVPLSLQLLVGSHAQVNVMGMMRDLTWMVTVPALVTMLLNQFSKDRVGKKLSPVMAPYGKMALIIIITINSTQIAQFILHMNFIQMEVIIIILLLAFLGYLIGWLIALLMHQDVGSAASMTFACGMRNISAGAVISAAYFPAGVMFPVMTGTLFQQILAAFFSRKLIKSRKKRELTP